MAHPKIDEALELFYNGDTAAAEVILQEVGSGKLEPPAGLPPLDEAAFLEGVGGIQLVREQGAEAAASFRKMIAAEEKGGAEPNGHATSWAKLGEALALTDALDDAIEAFTKAVKLKEECNAPAGSKLNVLFKYAECLFHRGKYKEAGEQFAKAAEVAEKAGEDAATLANLVLYRAESLKHMMAPMQASVRVQKGMQGVSAPPQVAILEQQLEGQFKEAIDLYKKAEEFASKAGLPDSFKLQIQRSLAETYHDAGRFVKGVMQRKKLVQQAEAQKLPPLELGFMYHGLGESQKEMGQHAEAADSFRRAISLKEKGEADKVSLGKSWFSLGETLGAAKKMDAAIEAFTKARDLEEASQATDDNHRTRLKKYWSTYGLCLQANGKEEEGKAAQAKAEAM